MFCSANRSMRRLNGAGGRRFATAATGGTAGSPANGSISFLCNCTESDNKGTKKSAAARDDYPFVLPEGGAVGSSGRHWVHG